MLLKSNKRAGEEYLVGRVLLFGSVEEMHRNNKTEEELAFLQQMKSAEALQEIDTVLGCFFEVEYIYQS